MIDSHHHLWKYSPEEYPWIPSGSVLAHDFGLADLELVTSRSQVEGTIAVQARQTTTESHSLLAIASDTDLIKAVVGWVPLVSDKAGVWMERLAAHRKFRGVRHVLQDEPDEFFKHIDFNRGLSLLPRYNLSFDLLLLQGQIPEAIRLVDSHPDVRFIIDHLAKPEIHNGRVEKEWLKGMASLAERDNIVGVKISGLVTEVRDGRAGEATFRNYFLKVLELFGSDRLMFGSDWPVCLLGIDTYQAWTDMVRHFISDLGQEEQYGILGDNARVIYDFA